MEIHETPQSYPRLRTWVSGLAVGLVAATFAWVQWGPDTLETTAASGEGSGSIIPLTPDDLDALEEEGLDAVVGPQRRVVEQQVGGSAGSDGDEAGPGRVGVGGGGDDGAGDDDSSRNRRGDGSTPGVSDSRVKLGATVAEDGIAKAFLGEVRHGINAVRNRVNGAGGVHGRQLDIEFKNDSWDPSRGQTFITNLINEGVFALAVSPSSEGLNAASNAGLFKTHGVPVVGADGLNNTQFLDPWIWPVAAATTTQAHVIIADAWKRCSDDAGCDKLRPAIVFGNTYRFGVEGAFAFNAAYCRVQGGTVQSNGHCDDKAKNIPGFSPGGTSCTKDSRFCGVSAGGQYTNETSTVKQACNSTSIGGGRCNFVLLLLEPASALSWMSGQKFPPAQEFERDGSCCGMAGAQPLFTRSFATECRDACHRMAVWTGYNPPIGPYRSEPKVQQYSQELQATSSTADVDNQFTLGGYIGMTLLVEALERVGPDLTREKLVETLNSMPPLKTGLTNSDGLRWTAGQRYANHSAQSFRIDYGGGRFNQFQPASGYIKDPWLGQDNKLP